MTVPPPGPLREPLASDDLLVVGDRRLPDGLVRRIRSIRIAGMRGVTAWEQFSLAQLSKEDRVYDLAAVDPASFRRFAGEDADNVDQWRRVALGETVTPAQHRFGPIDALVNEPRGRALGMTAGNALLLSTGMAAPQAVRAQIHRLAPGLSISALDIVAESGLDLTARQRVSFVGTFADAVGDYRYTVAGGGRVTPDPSWVRSHIVTEDVPILGTVTCNRYLIPQLRGALTEVQQSGLASSIHPDEYAGCYYPRFIAGTTTLSNHAFGLALDLNVPGNQRGTTGEMDRGVVAIFKRWGFAWGGDWSYTDPMHFELDRVVNPG